MHIPAEMLNGAVCPVTAAVSLIGVGASAALLMRKSENAPKALDFTLTGAAVFTLQMLNYPIWGGISGHLIGGVFAAAILGVPAGVLCMALVLMVQTLLFADGGLLMLGANVLNMALIGAGLGGLILNALTKRGLGRLPAVTLAGAASVLLAALALGGELALSGKATWSVIGTLLGVHLALAVVEGVACLGLMALVRPSEGAALNRRAAVTLAGLLVVALALTPCASAFPDAFEWTMESFALLPGAPNFTSAPFADYLIPAIPHEALSGMVAGLLGAAVVALVAFPLKALKALR